MVDSLRRDLTQVGRQCKEVKLTLPDINKILNGRYLEVIQEYKKSRGEVFENKEKSLKGETRVIKNENQPPVNVSVYTNLDSIAVPPPDPSTLPPLK